ncbi:MAG: protein kinase [Candidatus Latescibacteria bacterium]|nr:protein kinase [Candidatus Latescibacterota bacterium]
MTKTLQPEDIIAQYRVVGPLGAGGMGEVYLAQDQSLERNVALKVLPPDLVRSEDRVRRFVQEAKSASSLNHPNIVTIYEIGAEKVKSSSGVETGPLQFISMELVSGKTLGAKIHEEKTDLRTLLGYLAQAAEGIAKAHAAGIVHRDLKPGNIMVSDDGFAKVLDFGLAKLTEKRLESASATAMTEIADLTSEGAVLGTVHYMSPEQVQAKSVDHRSDIFSFGCLLYEAATRRRPFIAESNVETMHKIIHEKPAPIDELNPQAPAELRRLIRRCLAKAPDQRLQSMKDLAIELREIVEEYESLSASATSATTGSGATRPIIAPKSRPIVPIVVVALGLAGIAFGIWGTRRGGQPATQPFQNMRAVTQTSRGDVLSSTLSTDGRYLAYIAGSAGRSTLRVRQVATGSDVEIVPVQNSTLEFPSFSPDGNYLFFLKRLPEQPNYRTLVRVPSLGGSEEQKGFDVDTRVTFSPDAKRVSFVRGVPQEGRSALVVLDLDTGTERELASVRRPEVFSGSPAWSPDGERIGAFTIQPAPKSQSALAMFDVATGEREDFLVKKDAFFNGLAWIPDGSGLVVDGTVVREGIRSAVFIITYPRGELRRVTNDFNAYSEVAVAAGDGLIAALRSSAIANLFVADPVEGTARRLTSATSPEHSSFGLEAAADRVVFPAVHEQRLAISTMPFEGGEPRRLAVGPGHATNVIARGNRIFFQRYDDDGQQHVWRMNLDGSALTQLTNGGGENLLDVSRDASRLVFARIDSTQGVWLLPADGGEAVPVDAAGSLGVGFFSRDGDDVIVVDLVPDGGGLVQTVFRVVSVENRAEVMHFTSPPQALDHAEAPDGALSFLDRNDSARNVFSIKFAGGEPRQITTFTDGRLTDHEWSPDLKRIAVVRHDDAGENVWVLDAEGGPTKQVTRFDGEDVFQIDWTPDSSRILVRAGTLSRDVVLISNFR